MASATNLPMDEPLLEALAEAVGLPLDPRHRPGVAEALTRMLELGRIVAAAGTPDQTEPAPVFEP